MHLSALIEMVDSAFGDRVVLGDASSAITGAQLAASARAGAMTLTAAKCLVYVGENHPQLPIAVLAAAGSDRPFVPINYRLDDGRLHDLIARWPRAMVLAGDRETAARLDPRRLDLVAPIVTIDDWLAALPEDPGSLWHDDDNSVAIALFTSGTTSEPKAALLRHRHLMAYLLGSVEFAGADEDEAVLVSVPPYHVAGVANLLSNLYAGRRLVYLRRFDASAWLDTVATGGITHAMVVPTMLARIVETLDGATATAPHLRSLSYGGAKVSARVLASALDAFEGVGFVNAYGLTETASTIAVLGPEDHRLALTSSDPSARRRLGSVGRILPAIEVEIRDESTGLVLEPGETGLVFVRGEQVAGEYATGSVLDENGWFSTRDHGWIDPDGYLFIEGRADDTIIRGGENIAPAEIEEVLLSHPGVADACAVGVPDDEWGQRIEAVIVASSHEVPSSDELRELVRSRLRGSKTPDRVWIRDSLPHTDTGKLLRRMVLADLVSAAEATMSSGRR